MPTVGYKGGAPGFVKVVDDRTLAFPNYNGNGMYMAMGNILETSMVGLLFINWEKGHRLRLHGEASIDRDDELLPGVPRGTVRGSDPHHRALAELPALRPPHGAAGEVHVRSRRGPTNACAVLEAIRTGRSTSCPKVTRRWTRRQPSSDLVDGS